MGRLHSCKVDLVAPRGGIPHHKRWQSVPVCREVAGKFAYVITAFQVTNKNGLYLLEFMQTLAGRLQFCKGPVRGVVPQRRGILELRLSLRISCPKAQRTA